MFQKMQFVSFYVFFFQINLTLKSTQIEILHINHRNFILNEYNTDKINLV